jgi:hypothetical protein
MESAAGNVKKLAETAEASKSNLNAMQASLNQLKESAETAKKTFEHLFDAFLIREGINFIKEAVEATQEWAFSVQKLSQLTGVSAQAAGELIGVAKEEGVSVDTIGAALGRVSLALANHPQKFKELGIAIRDASGQYLPLETMLGNTVKGLEAFKAGADRDAASASLLGRGFANLLPELERLGPALNPENLRRMGEFLQGLGLAIDQNGIARAREWEKAQTDLGFVFLAFENQIGQAVLPVVKEFGDWIEQHARNGDLKHWAEDVARAMLGLVEAITEVGKALIEHRTAIELMLEVYGAYNLAKGNLVAGTAEIAAGMALATTNMTSAYNALDKLGKRAGQAKGEIGGLQSHIIEGGGEDNPPGTKTFTPVDKGAIAAQEAFAKLSAEIKEHTLIENQLTVAWQQGGKAVDSLKDKWTAYHTAMSLGKRSTQEMRDIIYEEALALAAATDRTKDAEKAEKAHEAAVKKATEEYASINKSLSDHIRLETDLTAAYGQGKAAVQAVIDSNKILAEIEKLGVGATQEQIAAVRELAQEGIQVDALAEQSKLRADNLKTAAQGVGNALETAFKNATTPGNDLLKTFNDLGRALQDLVLKALIFKPLEESLTAAVSSGGGGPLGKLFGSIFGGTPTGGGAAGAGAGAAATTSATTEAASRAALTTTTAANTHAAIVKAAATDFAATVTASAKGGIGSLAPPVTGLPGNTAGAASAAAATTAAATTAALTTTTAAVAFAATIEASAAAFAATVALAGSGGSGGDLSSLAGLADMAAPSVSPVATFREGGVVGGPAPMRSISSAAFEGAPRMQKGGRIVGLGADEVPIIAHIGETVIPAARSAAVEPAPKPEAPAPKQIIESSPRVPMQPREDDQRSMADIVPAAIHREGGIVGSPAPFRDISSTAFEGAPRMRNGGSIVGLGADEIPIIAHLGETITPAGKSQSGGSRPAPTIIQHFNIQTPDVGSFGASQGQLAADAYRHASSQWNRNS